MTLMELALALIGVPVVAFLTLPRKRSRYVPRDTSERAK